MNILQVNCVYGTGSTGNITRDLHRTFLALGHQSTVLYGRGPRVQEPFTSRVCSNWYGRVQGLAARIGGLPYGHCAWSTRQLLGQIRRIQPDVVHLQCLNGHFCNLYHLLTYLKEIQIPTVLTLHAEFPYTGGCSHAGTCTGFQQRCTGCPRATPETACLLGNRAEASWLQLRSIYQGWDRLSVVGCSRWIARRAAAASALAGIPVSFIPNGIDTRVFFPRLQAASQLRQSLSIAPGKRVILFAAPAFTYGKGFDLFLDLVRSCAHLPLRFLAAGDRQSLSLPNLTVLGHISSREQMAVLYSAADALVLCSRQDNFPTVCLEASACGTPVVTFSVGGVPETILPGLGVAVPPGDVAAMRSALQTLSPPAPAAVAQARARWDCRRMAAEYLTLYRRMTP